MMKHYVIWGTGLLGGSLGLDLMKQGAKVSCIDLSRKNLETLQEKGFDRVFHVDDQALWDAIKDADGVIIGTPAVHIPSILGQIEQHDLSENMWITDMASTKSDIMNSFDSTDSKLNFVGSHPMAGSDQNGPEYAREDLFQKATIYVTPSRKPGLNDSASYKKVTETVIEFWKGLGAFPQVISHQVHDKWAAYLSHGLHLVSCMVSHLIKDIPDIFEIDSPSAGGSFRDITRVAGSNPDLWEGIIDTNAKEVTSYLANLENLVHQWRVALEQKKLPVKEIFEDAARIRTQIMKQVPAEKSNNR